MTTENILPLGWQSINLGEFVLPQSGTRPYGGVTVDSGNIPSLGGENIKLSGGVIYEPVKKISEKFFSQMKKGILKDEDVLINKDGANTGKVGFYSSAPYSKASVNEHVFILRANPQKLTQKYLYYLLASEVGQKKVKDKISGSAQPGLNSGFLKGQSFAIPALINEQQAITSILSTIDEAIAQSESLLQKYQSIKHGLMFDLLTRGIDENGELRDIENHPELFKETLWGSMPKDWRFVPVQYLYKTPIRDFGSFSMTNLITFLDSGVPFIKSEMIKEDGFDKTNMFYISEDVHKLLHKSWVFPGNILYSKIGSALGTAIVYDGSLGICNSNAAVAKINVDNTKASSQFVAYLLNAAFVKSKLKKSIISLLPRLNLRDISNFEIPLPSLDEQKQIVKILVSIDKLIKSERDSLSKLFLLKQGLMQDLLSGQVRVKV